MKDTIQPKNGEYNMKWNANRTCNDPGHFYWDLLDGDEYRQTYEMISTEDLIELLWNTSNIHFLHMLTAGGDRILLFEDVDTGELFCVEIINS